MKYQEWLNGCGCCPDIQDCPPSTGNPCDCDSILLELSKQHTDDLVLQDEIDNLDEKKLDASAYTPVDLTDYYTKEEVDELIPSLDGYATEEWVNEQGFLKTVEPLKTINGETLIGEGNIVISGGSGDVYTKAETDAKLADKQDKLTAGSGISISNNNVISVTGGGESSAITVLSGDVISLSGNVVELSQNVQNISGDVVTISGDVSDLEGKIDTLSGNVYAKSETSSKTEIDDALDDKQDKLISGTNIKTINGESLLGSGNIEISGGSEPKAIVAGRGIKVTSGETADTIEFDLPIYTAWTITPREESYNYLKATDGLLVSTSKNDIFYQGYERKFAVGQGWSGRTAYDFLVGHDGKIYIDDYKDVDQYGKRKTYCLQDKLDSLQPILTAGTGIDITDNVISVTGGGESSGVTSGEVQTMIDSSISGKTNNSDFSAHTANTVIHLTSGDIQTQIDKSISGKADSADVYTKAETDAKLADKQNKLTAGTGIDITDNVISATGGGISYSAGTGIDITNNVISSTLNAYNGTGVGSLIIGQSANTASGDYSVAVGAQTEALGGRSFAQGLSGKTTNTAEITFGQLNDTKNAYSGFGHSGNTLFTVGNGAGIDGSTTDYARHNAFEVRSNGDIYIPEPSKVNPSHYYQAPMIKLQDRLNEIDNKPNIWCGSESQWSQISGSTESGTLYLIY